MTPPRAILVAARGFGRLKSAAPEFRPLRWWLDSCAGLGAIVDAMAYLGFDVALTRHGDDAPRLRALFYPASFLHVSRAGPDGGRHHGAPSRPQRGRR